MRYTTRRAVLATMVLGLMIGAAGRADADFLLDSGIPRNLSGLSVFQYSSSGQFLAQQFTLTSAAQVSTIEIYFNGTGTFPGTVRVDLTTAIGPSATLSNLIATLFMANPAVDGYVSASLNSQLAAGTYYLVMSAPLNNSAGSSLPYNAPNVLGTTYFASTSGLNPGLPLASAFVARTGGSELGIRISTLTTVPEPSSLALCGIAEIGGLAVARVRRKRAIIA